MFVRLPDNLLDGKISAEDVLGMYEEMEKTMILQNITFPNKPSSDGYYHVWVPDKRAKSGRKQYKAKTLERLKERVYKVLKEDPDDKHYTFKEVFEQVQDNRLKYIRDPEKRLSSGNTSKVYDAAYKRFVANTKFEDMPVDAITAKDIEELCLDVLSKYNIRKKAFMNLRIILRTTLKYAYEKYWIPDNPYARVDFDKYNDMFVRPEPVRNRVHTPNEVENIIRMIHQMQEEKPWYMPAYALELQILIGARRGEIPPLQWADVSNGTISIWREQITINKSRYNKKAYDAIVEHTKTYKDRDFPITNEIAEFLRRLQRAQEEYNLGDKWLFPFKTENGCIRNQIIYKTYKKICDELGIERSRECIKGTHSFRRNAITNAVNKSGGNIFLVAQLYGNSPEVAERNYFTGLDMDMARNILEQK